MKIIFRFILILLISSSVLLGYLSFFGFETKRFNDQIIYKIKEVNRNLEIELNEITIVFDPLKFRLNAKTIGPKIKNNKKVIEIENIKIQIPFKSFFNDNFLIENLEVSTKSLKIKNLISFIRSFHNKPELFILEKAIKKGYLIADIKLEFDSKGRIKDDFVINGFIKDTKLSTIKNYNFQKLDLIFKYTKDNLLLNDIAFSLNDLNFASENISIKKDDDNFLIKGNVNHKKLAIGKKNIDLFIKPFLPKINFKKLQLSSKNNFSFKVNKKFRFTDFDLSSDVLINEILIINELDLKNFLPNIKEILNFSDHQLSIKYTNDNLYIEGKGNILLQDKNDILSYSFNNKNDILDFQTLLKIDDNLLRIESLNYERNESLIKLEGSKNKKNEIFIKTFSINEKKNEIVAENLSFNKKFEIIKLKNIHLNYIDKENQKNQLKIRGAKNKYILTGSSFNANKIIDKLLSDDKNSNFFNIDNKIEINIKRVLLDSEYYLSDFNGEIFFINKEIVKANLDGNFSDKKNLKFTINTENNSKNTTLYVDKAEPLVRKYKFIKGFEEGILDFYSTKEEGESLSTLKIYDFKLKELPVLTKLLTLASLQGIADIFTGEGIRFNEFEMNFRNKGNLMTIDEIYAIGPAISILMSGYVERDKLISLRGTLVPATTLNKVIGSIPFIGDILVGKKTGEGVFGVSFKIKGPPKRLETTVNPIKTLTPRFITRTLEKIKKN